MAQVNSTKFGAELRNIDFGGLISNMGLGIAKAQWALDQSSIRVAQMMAGADYVYDRLVYDKKLKRNVVRQEIMPGVKVLFGGQRLSLLELGFTPTFYQFTETLMKIKMTLSMSYEETHEDTTSESDTDTHEDTHRDSNYGYERSTSSSTAWDLGLSGSVGRSRSSSGSGNSSGNTSRNTSVNVSTMNEKNASTYSFSAEMCSEMSTKLVPVPPPAVLTERIQAMIKRDMERKLDFSPNVVRLEKGEASESVAITLPDGASPGADFYDETKGFLAQSSSALIVVEAEQATAPSSTPPSGTQPSQPAPATAFKGLIIKRAESSGSSATSTEFRPEFVTITVSGQHKGKVQKGELTVFIMGPAS